MKRKQYFVLLKTEVFVLVTGSIPYLSWCIHVPEWLSTKLGSQRTQV
jgi:hypothetical protein